MPGLLEGVASTSNGTLFRNTKKGGLVHVPKSNGVTSSAFQFSPAGSSSLPTGGEVLGASTNTPAPVETQAPNPSQGSQFHTTGGGEFGGIIALAEEQANTDRTREQESLALERERIDNEFGALNDQINQQIGFIEDNSSADIADINAERDSVLGDIDELKTEANADRTQFLGEAEQRRNAARADQVAGFKDTERRLRTLLSTRGGFAGSSSAALGLIGQASQELTQQVANLNKHYGDTINLINRETDSELSILDRKATQVKEESLKLVGNAKRQREQATQELRLALTQNDKDRILSGREALEASKNRLADIDKQFRSYKIQVADERRRIGQQAAQARASAEQQRQENQALFDQLNQVIAPLLGGGSTANQVNALASGPVNGVYGLASTPSGVLSVDDSGSLFELLR